MKKWQVPGRGGRGGFEEVQDKLLIVNYGSQASRRKGINVKKEKQKRERERES